MRYSVFLTALAPLIGGLVYLTFTSEVAEIEKSIRTKSVRSKLSAVDPSWSRRARVICMRILD